MLERQVAAQKQQNNKKTNINSFKQLILKQNLFYLRFRTSVATNKNH